MPGDGESGKNRIADQEWICYYCVTGTTVSLQGRWLSIIHKMGGGADELQLYGLNDIWHFHHCITYLYFQ